MPLYEYECPRCERTVELLVRSGDEKVACPECGEVKLERLMSAPAAPNMNGSSRSLPTAGPGEGCGAPRCCGGICQ
ncbi:zinc ribbon domain-containing protein [Roseiconus nitratireducens]|uniref:Zinc ribbon domain-containing protein n=1 Tax=Roseiconus nitratireducens TaxID=2605748 RepID=A0A5M6D0R4_9BACT|nr:zinc ribbon domain-containing protein [Roseiconus nitratireducens]KAA5539872.1 zinc ribbon domain-containing protein [Roseiconus nitratireducens]